ncbi:YjcZ family sporulation protein [Psychrobacillus soli]|uniref:YjcZ family sporulation protein n=1 Tax=Psychrobacillus soli TaxID=1543965 RepID=A0A544SHE3_9BACI|nr:YjcZ family sporulation protein [Psychrobacillus soli]TQR04600.1 YjcZ family sporulation protein [Psychrobacillus soli]
MGGQYNGGYGSSFALIVVLFILLIIVGAAFLY